MTIYAHFRAGHVCQAIYSVDGLANGLEVVVAGGFIDNTADIYRYGQKYGA